MSPTEPTPAGPPMYVGPSPFRTGQPLFGRDREVSELATLLIAERVVVLHSPSGAGKTSLVQAGLVPRLRPPDVAGSEQPAFRSAVFHVPAVGGKPEADAEAVVIRVHLPTTLSAANRYVLSVLLSLETHLPEKDRWSEAELAGKTLGDYLDERFPLPGPNRSPGSGPYRPLVLLFDQFEEVLTLDPTDGVAKREFFRQFGDVLANRRRWVLIALREDYLADLDPYRAGLPGSLSARYRLDRLGPGAAREAIVEPAKRVGVDFQAADAVIKELQRVPDRPGAKSPTAASLPYVEPVYLQVVCRSLELKRKEPDKITVEDFEKLAEAGLPGVDRELARYYEACVHGAASEAVPERRIRDWIDKSLLTTEGRRNRAPERDGDRFGVTPAVVHELERVYLLRSVADGTSRSLELAHDRLAGPVRWDNNRWRDQVLTPFQRAAAAWSETPSRPPDMLVSGDLLADGEREAAGGRLEPVEVEFLTASRTRVAELRARLRSRLVGFGLGGLVGLTAVALVANHYQLQMRDRALGERQKDAWHAQQDQLRQQRERQRDRGDLQRQRSDLSQMLAGWEPTDGSDVPPAAGPRAYELLGLLTEARRQNSKAPDEESALRSIVQRLGWFGLGTVNPRDKKGSVRAVAFSPDGRWLAAGGDEGLVVWDLRPVEGPWLQDDDTKALDRRLREAGGGGGLVVRLPHLLTGRYPGREKVPRESWRTTDYRPTALTFVPGNRGLYVGNANGSVALALPPDGPVPWSAKPMFPAQGVEIRAIQLSAAPPGQPAGSGWVVCVAADGSGTLWRPGGQRIKLAPTTGRDPTPAKITAVDFTPNPKKLYAGTTDGHVFSWNLLSDTPPVGEPTEVKLNVAVVALAIHPSAQHLAVAPYRSSVAFWGMNPADKSLLGQEPRLPGREGDRLAFGMSGEWLAGQAAGRPLWLVRRPEGSGVQYSSAGGFFSEAEIGPVSAWTFDRGDKTSPHPRLLTGTQQGRVRAYDLRMPGAAPIPLPGPRSGVTAVALSDNQTWAAAGCLDGTVHLWNLPQMTTLADAEPRVLRGAWLGPVRGLAVSPNGERLVGRDEEGGLFLWDLRALNLPPRPLSRPGMPAGPGLQLLLDDNRLTAYAPVGNVGNDGNVAVWWDLTRPASEPFPTFDLAPAAAGQLPTEARIVTPDRKWVVSLYDRGTGKWELAVQPPDKGQDARYPVPGPEADKANPPGAVTTQAKSGPALLAYDGGTLAGVADGRLRVWPFDPDTGVPGPPTATKGVAGDRLECLAVGPRGRLVAAGTPAGRVVVWSVSRDGVSQITSFQGFRGPVRSVAFTPDGGRLAAGGADGTVRVWDFAAAGLNPVVLTGHTADVTALAFAVRPDGVKLVSAGADGTVRVWTLDPQALAARVGKLLGLAVPKQ